MRKRGSSFARLWSKKRFVRLAKFIVIKRDAGRDPESDALFGTALDISSSFACFQAWLYLDERKLKKKKVKKRGNV